MRKASQNQRPPARQNPQQASRRGGENKPAQKKKKPKGLSRYAKGLLIFIAVLVVLITLTLYGLWRVLSQYEKTTPRAALDAYFQNLGDKEYSSILADSDFEATELNTNDDYLALLHRIFGDNPENLTYRPAASIEGEEGQIYAIFSGEEKLGEVILTAAPSSKYGWQVRAAYDYLTPYTIYAPGNAQVYINGTLLSQDDPLAEKTPIVTFSDHPDPAQIPYTIQYQIEPTLAIPEVMATMADGTPCEAIVGNEGNRIDVLAALGEETRAAYAELIEIVSRTYANYISEDAPFNALSQYLYPETPLYSRMGTFYAGWYADHNDFGFRDMEVSNITPTSDTTFTGDISFVYEIYMGAEMHEFPTAYHLSFAAYGDGWRLLDLQVQ